MTTCNLKLRVLLVVLCWRLSLCSTTPAPLSGSVCPRLSPGSSLYDSYSLTPQLKSSYGYLAVSVTFQNLTYDGANGDSPFIYYCHMMDGGAKMDPILRVYPGEHLIFTLYNDVGDSPDDDTVDYPGVAANVSSPCSTNVITAFSTNIHIHGSHVLPSCHVDNVVNTIIGPGETFTYDFLFASYQPPGLLWYHPHVPGISNAQVTGGATGIVVIEGIENVQPAVGGLPEVFLVFRDEVIHNLTDNGNMPHKDLTLNFIPVFYPDYATVEHRILPMEYQFWRVANAGAGSTLNLQLQYDGVPQEVSIVALDGVPVGFGERVTLLTTTEVFLPPAARVEFIMRGPPLTVSNAVLITTSYDTGPYGDNNPERSIMTLTPDLQAPPAPSSIPYPTSGIQTKQRIQEDLALLAPSTTRIVAFSEVLLDPTDPTSPTVFYITVQGQAPRAFNARNMTPSIVTTEGTIEDWTIINEAAEIHVFHIHQMHFLLLKRDGVSVSKEEMQYHDDIMVESWTGVSGDPFPNITIRLDFNNITGNFVYHCHLLEHEDGGMMEVIRVLPRVASFVVPSLHSAADGNHLGAADAISIVLGFIIFVFIAYFIWMRYKQRSVGDSESFRQVPPHEEYSTPHVGEGRDANEGLNQSSVDLLLLQPNTKKISRRATWAASGSTVLSAAPDGSNSTSSKV